MSLALSGERVVITRDAEPRVVLQPIITPAAQRQLGAGKGMVLYMADDFDETPEDFREQIE